MSTSLAVASEASVRVVVHCFPSGALCDLSKCSPHFPGEARDTPGSAGLPIRPAQRVPRTPTDLGASCSSISWVISRQRSKTTSTAANPPKTSLDNTCSQPKRSSVVLADGAAKCKVHGQAAIRLQLRIILITVTIIRAHSNDPSCLGFFDFESRSFPRSDTHQQP